MALVAAAGCGGDDDTSAKAPESSNVASIVLPSEYKGEPSITLRWPPPKELEINDLKEGTGREAKSGDSAEINYVAAGYEDKKKYETTWDKNELFTVSIDTDGSVEVLDRGLVGMKVGGVRELVAPPDLVYDYEAAIYVVELVKLN